MYTNNKNDVIISILFVKYQNKSFEIILCAINDQRIFTNEK